MRPGAAGLAAAAALLALGVGTAVLSARRPLRSALPAADNPGPRGLAAARALLGAGGASVAVRRPGEPSTSAAPAAVVVVAAPRAALSAGDVDGLLAQARGGATVVVALGATPQPALLDALGLAAVPGGAPARAQGRAPHRLIGDLRLPAGGAALRVVRPGPLAVAGDGERVSAVSAPAGRGEVLILSGPAPLENAHLLEDDAVSLVTRLGALGPVVFDERFLMPSRGETSGGSSRALGVLALQLLLGGVVLVAARARRLGAVRPPPAAAGGRTARDYLASLAALYQRAGAEEELAAAGWGALRRRLERRHGVPSSLSDADAARRLARRSPSAALALARGGAALAAGGRGVLLAVTRAAADAERGLGRRS